MDTPAAEPSDPLADASPSRRRPRLSIRCTLIGIAALAVLFADRFNAARRQRDAVAEIREFGGFVRYDFEVKASDGSITSNAPPWIIKVFGPHLFHNVVELSVTHSSKNSAGGQPASYSPRRLSRWILAFPRLKSLRLGNQCNDDVLEDIGKLQDIEELRIYDPRSDITDQGFAHLKGLKNLRVLVADFKTTTDAMLEIFGGLPRLETLQVPQGRITQAGVDHLRKLPNLRTATFRTTLGTTIFAGPKAPLLPPGGSGVRVFSLAAPVPPKTSPSLQPNPASP